MSKGFSVDVVIPTYNHGRFIQEALDSVLNQSYKPSNVIVVDDGSVDRTADVVKQVKRSSPLPVIYLRKTRGGPSSARNWGIKHSKSEYIAFLDADDVWAKNKLIKQTEVFRKTKFPNLGIVYCDYWVRDVEGNRMPRSHYYKLNPAIRGKVFPYLLDGNRITGSDSAVLIKRDCFQKVGLFDEDLTQSEDWDLWLRMAKVYDFDFVNEKLVGIRRLPGSQQTDAYSSSLCNAIIFSKLIKEKYVDVQSAKRFRYLLFRQIIEELPSLKFYRVLQDGLTEEAKKVLFYNRRTMLKTIFLIWLDQNLPLLRGTLRKFNI